MRVKLLREGAKVPTRATDGSAGYDLCWCPPSNARGPRHPTGPIQLTTGVAVEIPPGFEGQVRGRSGLALKGVHVCLGTIDSDYRGEVGVIVWSDDWTKVDIHPGDRIAQLVISPVHTPEIEVVSELSETARGEGGFGSTGSR